MTFPADNEFRAFLDSRLDVSIFQSSDDPEKR